MEKRLLTIIALILLTLPAFSQNLVSSFMKEVDTSVKKNVMQINISGRMLNLAAKNDPDIDAETKKLFQNIDKISVVIGLAVDESARKKLNVRLDAYEELMSVIEGEQTIRMYTKETKGQIDEFVMCIQLGGDMTLMSITGKIDLEQIGALSKGVKVQGMEHLNKLDTKKKKK